MLLIFDGECSFCRTVACWIKQKLPAQVCVEPWQSLDLSELGLSQQQVTAAVWWLDQRNIDSIRASGHAGIGRALQAAGGFWGALGRLILLAPFSYLARLMYWLIARYRRHIPAFKCTRSLYCDK